MFLTNLTKLSVWGIRHFPKANSSQQCIYVFVCIADIWLFLIYVFIVALIVLTSIFILVFLGIIICRNSRVCCLAENFKFRVQCGLTNATNTYVRQVALDVERMPTTTENLPQGTILVAVEQIALSMGKTFTVSNLSCVN